MKNKKGFTLVELLVVIAILAILATVSIVGYTSFIKKAKVSNATVELTQIRDLMIAADIDVKDADLSDGLGSQTEAQALWNKIASDAGNLKGTLLFTGANVLEYQLDGVAVTYNFSTGEFGTQDPVTGVLDTNKIYAPVAE